MRPHALLALSLLAALPLTAAGAPATPGTPEEVALRAALVGHDAEATSLLARAADPELTWLAGRYALQTGDYATASRLLTGPEPRQTWGRIDLDAARGDYEGALAVALPELDAAMAGTHRDAMAKLLIGWAAERMKAAPADAPDTSAVAFLDAATSIGPSQALQDEAELAGFRLPEGFNDPERARAMLARNPGEKPDAAWLCYGRSLGAFYPRLALAFVGGVLLFDEEDAPAAAREVANLAPQLPEGEVLPLLERPTTDDARLRLRLDTVIDLVRRDPAAGLPALDRLIDALHGATGPQGALASEAMTARARLTPDPAARRRLWLAIAEAQGRTPAGDTARAAALQALLDGATDAASTSAALATDDGAGHPALLYRAIPAAPVDTAAGLARTDALWGLSTSFPTGPWCAELATRLVAGGVDLAVAERFEAACPDDASEDAGLVYAHARASTELRLSPHPGFVDATASAVSTLQVTQHTVDPEALFRGTAGSGMNPLDSQLDAFLLAPDRSWSVPITKLATTRIAPRGGGPLAAITVRAGDQRATSLVITEPLTVQLIGRGDDLAVAVLRGDRPAGGAALLVEDDTGVQRARTSADGIARLKVQGAVRVMATAGQGLGFGTLVEGASAEPRTEAWSVVSWDRAVPVEGRTGDVQVFATAPSGGAVPNGTIVQVVSRARDRSVLASVPVTLADGVGHARIFLQGDGELTVERGDARLAVQAVPLLGARHAEPVGITLSARAPQPGSRLVAHVHRLDGGAEALSAELTITTPWSEERRSLTLASGTLDVPVDLHLGMPGDLVSIRVELADGSVRSTSAVVADPPAIPALAALPPLVALGQAIAPKLSEPVPDAPPRTVRDQPVAHTLMVHAWKAGGEAGLWAPLGASLTLPSAGEWTISAWDGAQGPTSNVTVVDPAAGGPLAADSTWRGPAMLVATTAQGIASARVVRTGQQLTLAALPGVRTGWVTAAEGTTVPVVGEATPTITVDGVLQRGKATPLAIHAPAGSRVWAWVRDAAPGGALAPVRTAEQWWSAPDVHVDAWRPTESWGVAISAGLLAEEERVEEASDVKRMDFGFSAAAEKAKEGDDYGQGGLSGYGTGGGGWGGAGAGRVSTRTSKPAPFVGEDAVIGVIDGQAPGSFPIRVPAWVSGADIEVVVRTADGRWATTTVPVDVTGELASRPTPVTGPAVATADTAEILSLALDLPLDARLHVLEALNLAGVDGARLPAAAAWATQPATTAEIAIARHLAGSAVEIEDTAAIPDPRHAERALAALLLAGGDEGQRERARVSAERLLGEPGLESWAVARASLALWMSGHPDEAAAAAAQGPQDPLQAAAVAVSTGAGDPGMAESWWAIARAPGATAADRALVLHALLQPRSRARTTEGRPRRAEPNRSAAQISVQVEAPLARWRGETFERARFVNGYRWAGTDATLSQSSPLKSAAGRTVPVHVVVPPFALPTRVSCPTGSETPWVDVPPSLTDARVVDCTVVAGPVGTTHLALSWTSPTGEPLSRAELDLQVSTFKDSEPSDPMSDGEQLALGTRLATSTDPDPAVAASQHAAGLALLEGLQRRAELPPDVLAALSTTLLHGAVNDPVALIRAFQSFREHAPDGVLDLPVAAALAHAYATAPVTNGGDPRRALAAVRVVMDARFKEELAAVSGLQSGGLDLTALKLLRELVARYPETPTVTRARFLAPAMLLTRAEGDGDRLGYTRSSLRHTAAGELAAFLLLHREGWSGAQDTAAAEQAAQAASSLSDALTALDDEPRQASLAGPLAAVFAHRAGAEGVAWQLSLASAHATAVAGNPSKALALLADIAAPDLDGQGRVAMERGRVLEALGRDEDAADAYTLAVASGNAEARQRLAWLGRAAFVLPPTITLTPGMPFAVPANLKPGAEVTVTAIAIQLEAALLDSAGRLDSSAVRVTGLRPTASRTLAVGPDGDVPLPALPQGAYLLTVTAAGATQSSVLVRTDAELDVQGSGPTLVHFSTTLGRPLANAQVWAFQAGGPALTARTDATGSAFFPTPVSSVLARTGDQYALGYPPLADARYESLKSLGYTDGSGYAAPAEAAPARMRQNESDYEMLFDQDANQNVRAQGL